MKRKSVIIIIVIVVIILIAISAWLIYRKYFKKEEFKDDYVPPVPDYSAGGTSYVPASFPIKKGMRGQGVVDVQNAINKKCNKGLITDGEFGPKTEAALLSCYGSTTVSQATYTQMKSGSGGCPSGMKPDTILGCVSAYKPAPAPVGMQKGNPVYAKTPSLVLFSYPNGSSSFGRLANNFDLSKSIGLYETASTEGFSKVWIGVNYITNSGLLGKAPVWAYVYTNLIRK
jgi:hypothetical protein